MTAGKEIVWRVRGWLTLKAKALKAAVRAEQEDFRLSRKLQQLVIEDSDPSPWRCPLPAGRPSGPVVDLERQWRVENCGEKQTTKSVGERWRP